MAQHFDYIAIGGGSGGIASANRADHVRQESRPDRSQRAGWHLRQRRLRTEEGHVVYAGQIADALKYGADYGFDTTLNHFQLGQAGRIPSGLYRAHSPVLPERAGQEPDHRHQGLRPLRRQPYRRGERRALQRRSHPDCHRRPPEVPTISGRRTGYRLRRFLRPEKPAQTGCRGGCRLYRRGDRRRDAGSWLRDPIWWCANMRRCATSTP